MKTILFLVPALLGAFALAEESAKVRCELSCPQVKCPGDDAAKLCQCVNNRETKCKELCPKYKPQYLPCPISPPKPTETCVCEPMYCIQKYPDSCYCENANKKRCYESCGKKGPEPAYQSCPPLISDPVVTPYPTSFATKTVTKTTTASCKACSTSKKIPVPTPIRTNPICGGGRANYYQCDEGYTCIKDPRKPGCGPECDGLGICIKAEDNFCGGFAGFACKTKGQICVDDPRDDCDPKKGGADCGGVCIYDDKFSEE